MTTRTNFEFKTCTILLLLAHPKKCGCSYINLYQKITCVCIYLTPLSWAGYDTVFEQSNAGLSSKFSFSKTCWLMKTKESNLLYYLPIAEQWEQMESYLTQRTLMRNANSLIHNSNSDHQFPVTIIIILNQLPNPQVWNSNWHFEFNQISQNSMWSPTGNHKSLFDFQQFLTTPRLALAMIELLTCQLWPL